MSNPWIIDEADFYELETHEEQMRFLLRYAILAPSGHNTQPWSFRIREDGVEVFADTTRRLVVVDGDDRELLMSIGATIANFRVAAAHFGFDTKVTYESRGVDTLPVATITVCETCGPDAALATHFPAIRKRHTNREPFDAQPLEPAALQAICDVVDAYPGTLRLIQTRDRERVIECVEHAELTLMSRPAYRAELAEWIGREESQKDGLTAEAIGMPGILTGIAPWLVRNIDPGEIHAKKTADLARSATVLLAITSENDRIELVQTGEVLELLLLAITHLGLQYSFLSAPIVVTESREQLRALIGGGTRQPQLLLRIGSTSSTSRPTRRRPIEATLVERRRPAG